MPQGLSFDELHVVSDLHLGGAEGFQIFDAGAELAWWISVSSARQARALACTPVINSSWLSL